MAITSQGQSRAPGLPLYALGAGNFIVGIGAFIVIGILAPMLRDLGLSKGEAGALLTVYAIVYALA
jgi:predicted MFS family arabinose efflux permease